MGRLDPETGAPALILQEIEFLGKNRESSSGKLQEQGGDASTVLAGFYYQLFVEGGKHKRVYEQ